ncbi:MAG: N(4)-acetylcytidine aminohydrolase [Plesiomonas sp.]|uniref:N(4)-acetylcytidine aminohydrolase n=1 Tax=Plesiomonas sp. TaxID=2486279 RepID=UPI003F2D83A9
MPTNNMLTFYTRFKDDILAKRKTITIRDAQEANQLYVGQRLDVYTNPEQVYFCQLDILSVTPIAFTHLNETHAQQENMTLPELKQVIRDIYPGLATLYVVHFKLHSA